MYKAEFINIFMYALTQGLRGGKGEALQRKEDTARTAGDTPNTMGVGFSERSSRKLPLP